MKTNKKETYEEIRKFLWNNLDNIAQFIHGDDDIHNISFQLNDGETFILINRDKLISMDRETKTLIDDIIKNK